MIIPFPSHTQLISQGGIPQPPTTLNKSRPPYIFQQRELLQLYCHVMSKVPQTPVSFLLHRYRALIIVLTCLLPLLHPDKIFASIREVVESYATTNSVGSPFTGLVYLGIVQVFRFKRRGFRPTPVIFMPTPLARMLHQQKSTTLCQG
jgi:hypothetical protein